MLEKLLECLLVKTPTKAKLITIIILLVANSFIADAQLWLGQGTLTRHKIRVDSLFVTQYSTISANNFITPEQYGAKADFKRLSNIQITNNSNTIICTGQFSASDVGKLLVVYNSRIDNNYNVNRFVTMNTKITGFINSNSVICDSVFHRTATLNGYFGTNNFDAFQNMFNVVENSPLKEVVLNSGTYLIVPSKGTMQQAGFKGLHVKGSIKLRGQGQGISCLKIGEEHIQRVDLSQVFRYKGLNLMNSGVKILQDFSLLSADTVSTEYVNGTTAIETDQTANILMDIFINKVTIKGDWTTGYSSSRGGTTIQKYVTHLLSDSIQGKGVPVSYFSGDGATKKLLIEDCVLIDGDQRASDTLLNTASIINGSNVVTLTNPNLSAYDFYTPNGRVWKMNVNGVDMGITTSVTNQSTIICNNNANSTTSGTLITNYLNDGYYGHVFYVHPNVDLEVRNVEAIGTGQSLAYYGSNSLPGIPEYCRLINFNVKHRKSLVLRVRPENINSKPFSEGGFLYFENCPTISQTIRGVDIYATGLIGPNLYADTLVINKGFSDKPVFVYDTAGVVNIYNSNLQQLSFLHKKLNINNSVLGSLMLFDAGNGEIVNSKIGRIDINIPTTKLDNTKVFKFFNVKFGNNIGTYFYQNIPYNPIEQGILTDMFEYINTTND